MKISKIKTLRVSIGLTQRDLAQKSGISRATLSQLETSDDFIYTLTLRTLTKLAKALEVSVRDIIPENI